MRRGGATYYAAKGMSSHVIQKVGRWKSRVFNTATNSFSQSHTLPLCGFIVNVIYTSIMVYNTYVNFIKFI